MQCKYVHQDIVCFDSWNITEHHFDLHIPHQNCMALLSNKPFGKNIWNQSYVCLTGTAAQDFPLAEIDEPARRGIGRRCEIICWHLHSARWASMLLISHVEDSTRRIEQTRSARKMNESVLKSRLRRIACSTIGLVSDLHWSIVFIVAVRTAWTWTQELASEANEAWLSKP